MLVIVVVVLQFFSVVRTTAVATCMALARNPSPCCCSISSKFCNRADSCSSLKEMVSATLTRPGLILRLTEPNPNCYSSCNSFPIRVCLFATRLPTLMSFAVADDDDDVVVVVAVPKVSSGTRLQLGGSQSTGIVGN
jgi:hypothetical protein